MLRTMTAIAAGLALTSPAVAGSIDDTPVEQAISVPAPAPVAPATPNWTGFYGGVQLGWADVDSNAAPKGDDWIAGITGGYDYDLGDWVIGGGLDYDVTDVSLGGGLNLDSVFRAKLRGGVKIGNGLAYATGGYALADTNLLGDEDGYFIGAGYEHMVAQNISVGGEVLYHEFDNFGPTAVDVDATTYQVRATFRF